MPRCNSGACESNLGASAHRTQQLGGVSHCGSAVAERRGELGRLAEVVLRVLWWLVDDTCKHVEQQRKKTKTKGVYGEAAAAMNHTREQ